MTAAAAIQDNTGQSPTSGTNLDHTTDSRVNSDTEKNDDSLQQQQQQQSQPPAGPPPDGGFFAWLQVAGSFFLYFNSWGVLSAFGVFQTIYARGDLFVASPSNISWIGAIQYSVAMMAGLVAGPIYDRGHMRPLLAIGAFGVVFGHMMLSLCSTFPQVLLAEGFCIGIGAGCLFVCAISVLPGYFSSKLGLAIGIAASGSAFGAIVYSIAVLHLLKHMSFAWAVRVTGFIVLATLILPLIVMKQRARPAKLRQFFDPTAFRDVRYLVFVGGTFFASSALSTINSYISYFDSDNHFTSADMSFYVVAILNATSMFGRIIPNFVSDRIGPFNVIAPCSAATALACFCAIAVNSQAGMIIVTLVLGFFSASFISMPPVCFASLTENKALIGTRMGMGYSLAGLGYLAGAPAAGSVLGAVAPLKWNMLWVYGGVMSMAAGLTFAGIRISRTGFKPIAKA